MRSLPLVLLSACDRLGPPCQRPLSDWCDGPCPTLDERIAEIEAQAAATERSVRADLYRCADGGFDLAWGPWFAFSEERFDPLGSMFGASWRTDAAFECDGKYALANEYGAFTDCEDPCLYASVGDPEPYSTYGPPPTLESCATGLP